MTHCPTKTQNAPKIMIESYQVFAPQKRVYHLLRLIIWHISFIFSGQPMLQFNSLTLEDNMKKSHLTIIGAALLLASSASFASTYTCYRLVDGKPTGGFVKIEASSTDQANDRAKEKYKDLQYRFDGVDCR